MNQCVVKSLVWSDVGLKHFTPQDSGTCSWLELFSVSEILKILDQSLVITRSWSTRQMNQDFEHLLSTLLLNIPQLELVKSCLVELQYTK